MNIKSHTSAGWRSIENSRSMPLSLTSPEFVVSKDTACLSYDRLNGMSAHFEAIKTAFPSLEDGRTTRASIGTIARSSDVITFLLRKLQERSDDIRQICNSLTQDINTPLNVMRRVKQQRRFVENADLSSDGQVLLESFAKSVEVFGMLPELAAFCASGEGRKQDQHDAKGDNLEIFMERNPSNPLRGEIPIDFVARQLKPLRIAEGIKWKYSGHEDGDPRRDSIDLLLSYEKVPVITEVKMAGDDFASIAMIQLLYYAAVFANTQQNKRLRLSFPDSFGDGKAWLAIIAQVQDEAGFHKDLESVVQFLKLSETRAALGKHFGGIFVLVIEGGGPPFRTVAGQEHCIKW